MTQDRGPRTSHVARRLLSYCAGLALAVGLGNPGAALAQSAPAVDLAKWTPEYIKSIAGTIEVDTAAECAKVVPLDYKGRLTYWYVGPNEASPPLEHQIDAEFWAAFAKTYPNITVEKQNLELQRDARQAAHRGPRQAPRRWWRSCRSSGASSSPPRATCSELQPEDVGYTTSEFWPGRHEVGHLGRQDLRRADQQRDDGVHLERRDLRGGRARSGEGAAGHLGRRGRLLQADQGEDRQERLRHGGPRQRRQHAVPLHAAALGLWRRRARRGRSRPDLREGL